MKTKITSDVVSTISLRLDSGELDLINDLTPDTLSTSAKKVMWIINHFSAQKTVLEVQANTIKDLSAVEYRHNQLVSALNVINKFKR